MPHESPQPVNDPPRADGAAQTAAAKIPAGLNAEEAQRRLAQYGPNEVAEKKAHPVLGFLGRFWAPVPWMLEATLVLELALGKRQAGRSHHHRRAARL